MSYEFIDRQPYFAEVVDQGLSETKDGNILFKLFFKILGKVIDPADPEKNLESIGAYQEAEMRFGFNGTPEMIQWRMRDLASLGFKGESLEVLDPRTDNHQSFVGQKILVSPNIKSQNEGEKPVIYWNLMQAKKRFVRDLDLKKSSAKLNKLSAQIKKALDKETGTKETVPF